MALSKRYSYSYSPGHRDKQRPNAVASITWIHLYLPVTLTVHMIGCPYYCPYYSKPSESLLRVLTEAIFLATAAGYRDDPTHASVLDGPVSQMSNTQTNDSTHTGHGTQPPRIRSAFPARTWSLLDPTAIVALARG